jgi:hypothetical protein
VAALVEVYFLPTNMPWALHVLKIFEIMALQAAGISITGYINKSNEYVLLISLSFLDVYV